MDLTQTENLTVTLLPTRETHRTPQSALFWFYAECRVLRLQRLKRRTDYPLSFDRDNWVRFVRRKQAYYRDRECEYKWEAKIDRKGTHAKDQKRLWATFNGRLGRYSFGSHFDVAAGVGDATDSRQLL